MNNQNFSISDTISNSLRLAWQHKMLWIFALLIGGGIGSGGNSFSNSMNSSSNTDTQNTQQEIQQYMLQENSYDNVRGTEDIVLPEGTSNTMMPVFEQEFGIKSSTESTAVASVDFAPPPLNYEQVVEDAVAVATHFAPQISVVFVSFFVFILFMIALGLIVRSWATGAFINGIDDAIAGTKYTFAKLGTAGRISMKELVKYKVFISLLNIVVILILFTVPALLFLTGNEELGVGLSLFSFTLILIYFVLMNYGNTFAIRFVALEQRKYLTALKGGLNVFKNNFINSLVLSCANCLVGGVMLVAVVMIMGIFAVAGVASVSLLSNDSLQVLLAVLFVIIGIPLTIAFIMGFTAFGAYMATYTNFTWSFLFNFATNRGDNTQQATAIHSPVVPDDSALPPLPKKPSGPLPETLSTSPVLPSGEGHVELGGTNATK